MSFKAKIDSNFEIDIVKRTEWSEMPEAHFHDSYEIYYLMQGEVYYFIENGMYSIKKGDMVLIPRGVIHKTRSHDNPDSKRVLISFEAAFVQDLLKDDKHILDCFDQKIISLTKNKKQLAENIINQLLEEYSAMHETNYALVKCLFGQLLIMLCRQIRSAEFEMNMEIKNITSQNVKEIIEYINKEYKEEITLLHLAKKFYMSTAHLSRIFKKVTGFHYSEYLINVRLKQAANLLLNSDLNITQIAFETGFNSSNHFCKSFKSVMGISPLNYRKQNS